MLSNGMDLEREKELVRKAGEDPAAFGELYEEHYGRIYGYVLRRTASVEDARDITAEVFIKAFQNISRFNWRGIPFSAWLFRVAGNEITNGFRRSNHRQMLRQKLIETNGIADKFLGEEAAQAEDDLQKHEEFLLVHNSIAKLPPQYQEVIVLHYFERKKLREISDILGKREGTVKSLLHRGLEKLRKLMQ